MQVDWKTDDKQMKFLYFLYIVFKFWQIITDLHVILVLK